MNNNIKNKKESRLPGREDWATIQTLLPFLWPKNELGVKARVLTALLCLGISKLATVLVPVFNVKEDKKVLKIFRKFFTNRKVIAIDCSDLIWGFGAIHCMTQQEPKI